MTQIATTRLEAVNIILATLGESPVNTLSGAATNATVAMAVAVLDEVSKETQLEGWHWNRESEVTLAPNVSGEIEVPSNVVQLDVADGAYPSMEIIQRGSKVYDKRNHTYVFTAPMKFEVIYLLDFSEVPEAARNYIITRAARKTQDRILGAQEHHAYNMRDEQQARVRLQSLEDDTGDHNVFHNYGAARVIDRGYPQRGVR